MTPRRAAPTVFAPLQLTLDQLDRQQLPPDPETLRPRLVDILAEWDLIGRHVQQSRQLLSNLLVGRLKFEPVAPGLIRFHGEGTLAPLVGALDLPPVPASGTPRRHGSGEGAPGPARRFRGARLPQDAAR
jgi:hypothetical protein